MKYLLVYEEIPESTTFYVFEEPTDEQSALLRGAHRTIINCEMNEEQERDAEALSEMLASLPPNVSKHAADGPDLCGPFERVFWAGFAL